MRMEIYYDDCGRLNRRHKTSATIRITTTTPPILRPTIKAVLLFFFLSVVSPENVSGSIEGSAGGGFSAEQSPASQVLQSLQCESCLQSQPTIPQKPHLAQGTHARASLLHLKYSGQEWLAVHCMAAQMSFMLQYVPSLQPLIPHAS